MVPFRAWASLFLNLVAFLSVHSKGLTRWIIKSTLNAFDMFRPWHMMMIDLSFCVCVSWVFLGSRFFFSSPSSNQCQIGWPFSTQPHEDIITHTYLYKRTQISQYGEWPERERALKTKFKINRLTRTKTTYIQHPNSTLHEVETTSDYTWIVLTIKCFKALSDWRWKFHMNT